MRWIAILLMCIVCFTLIGCATPTSSIESGAVVEDASHPDHVTVHVTWRIESKF